MIDAEYHYVFWRPIHAVRRADTDGNPATEADSTWTPLLFVNHPEYAGAQGCVTTAITETLAAFFGTDKVAFSMDSTATRTTRYYERLSEAAKEIYDARTWAGLHFRNSTMRAPGSARRSRAMSWRPSSGARPCLVRVKSICEADIAARMRRSLE